jgi:hypothetical protein
VSEEMKVKVSLFAMRLGVFIVFMAWTIDKIVNYSHNSGMIQHYYGIAIAQPLLLAIGIGELIILLLFFMGKFKKYTYGFILIAHTVTTIISGHRLFPPYETHQLLYFGSLPMLGACIGLFLMKEKDTLFTLGK